MPRTQLYTQKLGLFSLEDPRAMGILVTRCGRGVLLHLVGLEILRKQRAVLGWMLSEGDNGSLVGYVLRLFSGGQRRS